MTPQPKPGSQQQPRKRGAQPGNTNAFKHGRYADAFYDRVLSANERQALKVAQTFDPADLTRELALMRVKLRTLCKAAPSRVDMLADIAGTLCRVAATNYNMRSDQTDDLAAVMGDIIGDIKRTMGEE